VLVSTVWTILCAVLIVGWQVTSWLQGGIWDPSLSSMIRSLQGNQDITYATASANKPATEGITDWFLEIPAIVPLLIASALLLVFYAWLATIEQEDSTMGR
jgi:hypothetical protein